MENSTNPAPAIMAFFRYAHLEHELAATSKPFAELAWEMHRRLPDGEEKNFCLRQLLLAKDAAVRASL